MRTAFGQDGTAPIRSTRGCLGLVRFGERYPTVPVKVLWGLMGQAALAADYLLPVKRCN